MPTHIHSIPSSNQVIGVTGGSQPLGNLQLSLSMIYIICTFENSLSPDSIVRFLFIGQIVALTGNSIPSGWVLADGSLISIRQSTVVFAVISTTYGSDHRSNYRLPNLRGQVGVDMATGRNTHLGDVRRTESITFLSTNSPSHQHNLLSSAYDANQTESTSGEQPFQNAQPSLGINYNISLAETSSSWDDAAIDSRTAILREIVEFADSFVPKGWSMVDGRMLSISYYTVLFSLLGANYGGGG
ncbi:unnamed protein product [Rotaria sp. Silwood1]|nr:unnamed protein product [Rotaria sp. Silwood1]